MPTVRLFGHYLPLPLLLLAGVEFTLCFLAGYTAAQWHGAEAAVSTSVTSKALAFALVMTLSIASMGLYQTRTGEGFGPYLLRLLVGVVVGGALLAIVFYVIPSLFLERSVLANAGLMSVTGIIFNRLLFERLVGSRALNRKALVLGAGHKALALDRALAGKHHMGARIVGFIPIEGEPVQVDPARVVDRKRPLQELMPALHCEELVIAVSERRNNLPMDELMACKANGVTVLDENTFFERETGKISIELLSTGWLLASDGFRNGEFARYGRRLFDILVAGGLLVTTAPIMLLTALAIRIEDGAPVLYRQQRVGEHGALFELLKFRSMRQDAESDGVARWAEANDARVTRVGRVIRRLRIDELPQLFNILRGDMGFVGPRPERPEFVRQLAATIPFYAERHRIKPGLTGWAQLRYHYGASEEDAAEKLQFDLYYLKNHSLFLDLLILLQTVEVVVFGRGAR